MNNFKKGVISIPNENMKVEFLNLQTIEVDVMRYDELIRKEAQLDLIKKFVENKTSYINYADISDLKILLDIKERNKKVNE